MLRGTRKERVRRKSWLASRWRDPEKGRERFVFIADDDDDGVGTSSSSAEMCLNHEEEAPRRKCFYPSHKHTHTAQSTRAETGGNNRNGNNGSIGESQTGGGLFQGHVKGGWRIIIIEGRRGTLGQWTKICERTERR